jgi:hypothetical protein
MVAYFVYYLAKATLCFLAPEKHNHGGTRGCVYDDKIEKKEIVLSMKAGALCDDCRRELLGRTNPISPFQLTALDKLFQASGELLEGKQDERLLPRAFIGSSSEGLAVAGQLKKMLHGHLSAVVWNQGTVFGLGNTTIESLESAVLQYSWGIFVLTRDDIVKSRGIRHNVARDNVLFEAGLFMGKLTRRRVLMVQAKGASVPSDLAGLTTAHYDPTNPDLVAALAPAVEKINSAIGRGPSDGAR